MRDEFDGFSNAARQPNRIPCLSLVVKFLCCVEEENKSLKHNIAQSM